MAIHPTALVDPGARLSAGVRVGPYAVIESDVEIGEDTRVMAHAVLKSGLRLGRRVLVHEGAVLGGPPQDAKFRGAPSRAVVEDDVVLREFTTIHRSARQDGVTRVGKGAYVMGYGHIAHDCDIGAGAIVASYVAMAGHVRVGRKAFVSGGVAIHQFSRVGELAMIGGGSKVNLDVPPFVTVDGVPARAVGLNTVGLRRAGISEAEMRALKRAFRILFREKRSRDDALTELGTIESELVSRLAAFVRASERGVCRARSS